MARTPHFYKIILEDALKKGKLRIPKKFVRRYRNYLQEQVSLKVPNGAKWQVELVKTGDAIWLGNGWQHFVDYYSLSHGSFLVFGFEDFKNCTFNVLIFDKTTSEIDYPYNVHGDNEKEEPNLEEQFHQLVNQENIDVDVCPTRISEDKSPLPFSRPCKKMKQENCRTQSEEIIEIDVSPPRKLEEKSMSPFSRPWKKMKQENDTELPQANKGNSHGVVKRTQRFTTEEKANALNRANMYCESNNVSFSIIIQPTHVGDDSRVAIPASFANKYLKNRRGYLILNSVDDKTWLVEYVCTKTRGFKLARICGGWRKFIDENHLEVGDVCVFEVINHNVTELKVVISRENQDANGCPPIEITEIDVSPPRELEEKSISPFSRPWKKMKQENGTELQGVDFAANKGNSHGVVKRTQRLTTEEKANALNRANIYYESNNLSFSIVIQPTHVGDDPRVAIPASFANKYLKDKRGYVTLNSVDGKTWLVEYVCTEKKRGSKVARMCSGWRKFVDDNHLEVGDVCVFEVINHNATKLKVVISRENQDANRSPPIGNHEEIPCFIRDLNK
ncbi:B3 domain-containing transcription factor VRN1-like [Euphorbia lathyris]|uniref:B3 domain-containing transcription factor VRN1-like n=1 Tax=Euphorbia lathyris TaxID=212925 RepID=UPI003313E2A6